MLLNKKKGEFLRRVIDEWLKEGTIPQETAERLRQSVSIRPFDWEKLAKYSFWIAIFCLLIAVGSALVD
ncbi:MAG: hypothetical protein LBD68_02355, partial [Zoogloeaceae bacterium]|nr:hypothetical protein [Zoogloeaceae bacterium]